jgi:hypothetical protein
MFITPDKIIDSIQDGKKQIVNTFIADEKFKTELIKLIDAQAKATKTSVEASLAITQAFVKNSSALFKFPGAK